jgi:hypothetical protein
MPPLDIYGPKQVTGTPLAHPRHTLPSPPGKVIMQGTEKFLWQHGHPVFLSFSVLYHDLAAAKIKIHNAEPHTFHKPPNNAIKRTF